MNLKRRIANSGGCFSMFSLAVWICIWFTNLSIFDLRSREDNRCWDSLFLVHDLFYSCWVNGHNPHHGILRSTGTTPSENENKKQNKKKKNEKENEKWEEEWTRTERQLDQTRLILQERSVGFPLTFVTASKRIAFLFFYKCVFTIVCPRIY